PNPFSGRLHVRFSQAVRSAAIDVFDVIGRRIARTTTDDVSTTLFTWDGEFSDGTSMPSGVYLFRVQAESVDGSRVSHSAIAVKIPS
ncbi:MAG: T9SS type A sorting domain-containing protein, partial [Rhodothermia bacterium]|nr:T9SS type A sorting domain-containing protein [Rhodothermia bacterium]